MRILLILLRNACLQYISGYSLCLLTCLRLLTCDFRDRTELHSSTMRELGSATLAESVILKEGVEASSTSPVLEVMPAGLAVTIAGASWALCDSDAVVVYPLCVARESVESKIARSFFRLSADARAAASAFLFVLNLGAIVNRSLFHKMLPFQKKNCACAVGSTIENYQRNVTSAHGLKAAGGTVYTLSVIVAYTEERKLHRRAKWELV